ncbi:hypothetical protein J2R98_000755 [Alkalibacillus filiformis]|uniref:Uncharacterized protein n=1 Tax=Alkalibacillus filiformis TaxID=200990 RepID=A0ABU0DR93_9BACI|nr:hypothetical protein [Alkalibacillus filiformis]MDQ0350952.1 hypothetical protein [Alkalibacillus filiformis]
MVNKLLLWILFVLLLIINTFIYRTAVMLIPHPSWLIGLATILIYFIVIIPLTLYVTEKLIKYATSKGKALTLLLMATPVLIISLYFYNEYREKSLDQVMNYNEDELHELVVHEGHEQEWRTDEQEHAEAISEFLSQYQVKKMRNRDWDSDVSNEKGFRITIYKEGSAIMTSIYEDRLLDVGTGPYEVVNGPVDIGWIENYIKKHQ